MNPYASAVSPRTRVVVNRLLSARHDVTVALTTRRHHATALARRGVALGTDAVVVLGGDGTLNEAANGLVGTETALATLPGGSTNVFARTLGLPDDPIDAAEAALGALEGGLIERVGLGAVNHRYFLFHVGIGFDAAVVERVERRSDLKRALNHALFVYSTLDTWWRHFDRSEPYFAVELPDGRRIDDGFFAVCLNTNPYTYLGTRPLNLAPKASLGESLALVSVRDFSAGGLARLALQALRGDGGVAGGDSADYVDGLTEFRVVGYRPVPVQVDGDFAGRRLHLRLTYRPEALRLVLPFGY